MLRQLLDRLAKALRDLLARIFGKPPESRKLAKPKPLQSMTITQEPDDV